jgi:hypothetical protein
VLTAAVESQVITELQQMANLWPVKPVISRSVSPGETEVAAAAPGSDGSIPIALPSPAAAHGVRPEIAQLLREAQLLSNAVHPDEAAVMEKIKAAEAMPNLNHDEKIRMAFAEANLPSSNHSGLDAGPVLVNGPPLLFGGRAIKLGQSVLLAIP